MTLVGRWLVVVCGGDAAGSIILLLLQLLRLRMLLLLLRLRMLLIILVLLLLRLWMLLILLILPLLLLLFRLGPLKFRVGLGLLGLPFNDLQEFRVIRAGWRRQRHVVDEGGDPTTPTHEDTRCL